MAGNDANISDQITPMVQPAPSVTVLVTVEGEPMTVTLVAGQAVQVCMDVSVELLSVTPRVAVPVNENGKVLFRVFGVDGSTTTDYVRTEQRAREIFIERFPDETILSVTAI